jgi:hypothetical protein
MENQITVAGHPEKRISLPGSAAPIIQTVRNDMERGWICGALPAVTEELKSVASICKQRIEDHLAPARPQFVKEAVAALLVHFFNAKMGEGGQISQAVYRAIGDDWQAVLGDQPEWAIMEARIAWLKDNNRRPKPHDIRRLCNIATAKERALLAQCERIRRADLDEAAMPTEPERTWDDLTPAQRQAELEKVAGWEPRYRDAYLASWNAPEIIQGESA